VNTNWNSDKRRVSEWYGITVLDKNITRIDLSNNNLVGTIPTSIADLIGLKTLNLGGNKLKGTVAQTIPID
jgi:Leucine-rich repeat (LRR) protein